MPRKLHAALLDGNSYKSSPEWLPKMSQEATGKKGRTCLMYFYTGVRTELLLLHTRAPSLLWSLFSYCSSFPGETSTGKNLRQGRIFPQHHSCFQPCPQPPLSGCINAKLSAALSRPLAALTVCRASRAMVNPPCSPLASVLCPHMCSHPSGLSPPFLHGLTSCVVAVGLISLLLPFMQ